MRNDLLKSNLNYLYQAILSLENEDECRRFLSDLCTIPELNAISQRLLVARMLDEGKVYNEIVKESGASTAIVSRVKRSILYGENGYEVVFGRLNPKSE